MSSFIDDLWQLFSAMWTLQCAEQIIIHALNQHASDQKSLRKIYGE
jgi:hypothetical protein